MDAFKIHGGVPLSGNVEVSGSKNASLPILAAALLTEGECNLVGAADVADVRTLGKLLGNLGAEIVFDDQGVKVDATKVNNFEAPYDLVRTMRASILVLGPLLARFGHARVSLPGGCAIGARPIDQHLKGFEQLGAKIHIEHGYVVAEAKKLRGTEIMFDLPTVGGTENLMLAACLAEGVTVLRNAAREPEVVDLARALIAMGVEVSGAGTSQITIHGATRLKPFRHQVIADRIEFGTFLVAGALAGEPLDIKRGLPEQQAALIDKLQDAGASVETHSWGVRVKRIARPLAVDVHTEPYPGFPTDMQAQLMALLTVAGGTSIVTETIFENRFMHVPELNRLGAMIRVEGGRAEVCGVPRLSGTTVMATDLRASASLVLAGLIAEGETVIRRIYHLDRGYQNLSQKLKALGARIERFSE